MTDILQWISLGNLLLVVGSTNFHLRLTTKLHLYNLLLYLHSYRSINSISDDTWPSISDNRTIIARLLSSILGAC